ncbi:hypothetical protein GIV24_01215 [Pseudomonas syringae]|nr:hypothetical protein [Pseudomonas syringae]
MCVAHQNKRKAKMMGGRGFCRLWAGETQQKIVRLLRSRAGINPLATKNTLHPQQALTPQIKVLPAESHASRGVMALSYHELSVENAVIPFSLSLPSNDSSVCPATFEMEHFRR